MCVCVAVITLNTYCSVECIIISIVAGMRSGVLGASAVPLFETGSLVLVSCVWSLGIAVLGPGAASSRLPSLA